MSPMGIDPEVRLLFDKTQLLLEISAGLYTAVRDSDYDRASSHVAALAQVSDGLPDLLTTLRGASMGSVEGEMLITVCDLLREYSGKLSAAVLEKDYNAANDHSLTITGISEDLPRLVATLKEQNND